MIGDIVKRLGMAAGAVVLGMAVMGAAPVTELRGEARDGQVFVTWREGATAEKTTFNVYVAERPITDVTMARRVGHHVERHSARDWWEDPASFAKGKPAGKPVGFLIKSGGERLDPGGGLFVHTPKGAAQKLYFAVTCTDGAGKEDAELVAGANATREAVTAAPGALRPVWQAAGTMPAAGAGKGKALWLNIHAKGGVVSPMEYLVFGDETMGWREGLAFKFSVRVAGDEVVVRPTDRVWIGRPHNEASDGGTPAIWTFWYGYNSAIFDRALMAKGVPTNYTERRNLFLLDWVKGHYQVDATRWHCSGSSMGGCGTVSFGLRHPELFAGLHANVPIVAYTYLGAKGSATRLEPSCWVGTISEELKTNEGVGLLRRMDGTRFVRESKEDLPMLFLVNGRKDGSIPWQNNPAFYRALNDAKQAFAVYWDNGDHATCGKEAPADVKGWLERFRTLRRDRSYPAFSNTSTNRNPGDGRPEDGDIVGWMNRGMEWGQIEDGKDRYAITVKAEYPGIEYPVKTDVTLRRVQQFRTAAGERVEVRIGGVVKGVVADGEGRITVPGVVIGSREGTRIVITRR